MEEFWQLINPELHETVQVDRLLAFLAIFVTLAIDMRLTVELLGGRCDQSIRDYLQLVSPSVPREDLAANLLGFANSQEMKSQVTELDKLQMLALVQFEHTMSTLGIRLKLLDCRQDTHHTLIEEGL